MHIETAVNEGKVTLRLNGEFDLMAAEKFIIESERLLIKHNPKLLVIDLEAVPFIDSSGLGAILGRYKKITEKGGKIILTSVKAPVNRILKLSGFHKIMDVYSEEYDDSERTGLGV